MLAAGAVALAQLLGGGCSTAWATSQHWLLLCWEQGTWRKPQLSVSASGLFPLEAHPATSATAPTLFPDRDRKEE